MPSSHPSQRILLTGASGAVGRAVLPALTGGGAPVRLLVHRSSPEPPPGAEVETARGDLLRPGTLRAAVEGCDVVVHAAAPLAFGSLARDRLRQIHLEGTEALLREAQAAGVRLFALLSYTGTIQEREVHTEPVDEATPPDGRFESPAVRMKYEAEVLTLEANASRGMRTVVVSAGVLASPATPSLLSDLVGLFLEGELPYRILESVWLALSDGGDVGRCLSAALALGHGGRRYFATGECLRLGDLYTRLSSMSGVPAPRRRLPDLLVEELGLLTPVLPRQSFLRRLVLPRELVIHLRRLAPLTNERTRRELAFTPTPVERTLADLIRARSPSAGRGARVRG